MRGSLATLAPGDSRTSTISAADRDRVFSSGDNAGFDGFRALGGERLAEGELDDGLLSAASEEAGRQAKLSRREIEQSRQRGRDPAPAGTEAQTDSLPDLAVA